MNTFVTNKKIHFEDGNEDYLEKSLFFSKKKKKTIN